MLQRGIKLHKVLSHQYYRDLSTNTYLAFLIAVHCHIIWSICYTTIRYLQLLTGSLFKHLYGLQFYLVKHWSNCHFLRFSRHVGKVYTDISQKHNASTCRMTDYRSGEFFSNREQERSFKTRIHLLAFPTAGSEKDCHWNFNSPLCKYGWPKFPKTFWYRQHISPASYVNIHPN